MSATITFTPNGNGHCLYTEIILLGTIGALEIRRATSIEFNDKPALGSPGRQRTTASCSRIPLGKSVSVGNTRIFNNTMKNRITNYIRAAYPALYLVSAEEQRVESELKAVADGLGYSLCYWTPVNGLVNVTTKAIVNAADPLEALDAIGEAQEKSIFILKDLHLYLDAANPNPVLVRKMKDLLVAAKATSKTLIILGLPDRVASGVGTGDHRAWISPFPARNSLGAVLDGIMESAALPAMDGDHRSKVLESAKGLTTIEAENAMALSVVETKTVTPEIVAREKAQALKKGGILEVVESRVNLDLVGGMDVLKSWLVNRQQAFTQRAVAYGLPCPKGLLILGIPGTGKSLTAKATASVFGVPLLRLDAGKLFGSLVGQSEANLRSAIATAEAISPVSSGSTNWKRDLLEANPLVPATVARRRGCLEAS
jgi:hypothetical protein